MRRFVSLHGCGYYHPMSASVPAPVFPRRAADLRRRLLAWYHAERRTMPWREKPSAYGTVVSEFMLQQTQVAAVIPYFERFLREFPGFAQLARASEESVLAAWSGLGYYRRARFLKKAAETILRNHSGKLPNDAESLRALPGFGEYTTAAVGSIALGHPLACVDGNVRRVVARLTRLRDPSVEQTREIADALLDRKSPGDWNQAMMELGATVCTPRAPRCMVCPVRIHCAAFTTGDAESYPAPKRAEKTKHVSEIAVAVLHKGKALVLQRAHGNSFGGMWELPRLDSREVDADELSPEHVLKSLTGLAARAPEEIGSARSVFTHHRINSKLFRVAAGRTAGVRLTDRHTEFAWIEISELASLGASRAQKRLFELIQKSFER